jgi:cyclopropane-fatty-acyl-phospholipid synthase
MTSVRSRQPACVEPPPAHPEAAQRPRRTSGLFRRFGARLVQRTLAQSARGRVRLIDASSEPTHGHEHPRDDSGAIEVRVLDPRFYAAAALGGSLGIAESYIDGDWDADDLAGLIEIMARSPAATRVLDSRIARLLAPFSRLAYSLQRNTRKGSRRNIRAHYDLGNEFFSLFLDPTMTYSCAVFDDDETTLEEGQRAKIDRACRALDLRPSDHLLEIGTGWGGLAIRAAREFGCRVTTTTVSDEQYRFASDRVREAGLHDRVSVLKRDYRDLAMEGACDKIVSIEMIEAVGRERLSGFFAACSRALKPGGAALIQSIVIRDDLFERAASRRDFLKKHIFPGSCLPSVAAIRAAAHAGGALGVRRVDPIGTHYPRTLRLWRDSFRSRIADVRRMGFDNRFIRTWEYYLAYCEGAFRAGSVDDVQVLLSMPARGEARCETKPEEGARA